MRHDGPCGQRLPCWREECLAEYGDMLTVEVLPTGEHFARCHGGQHQRYAA